MADLKCRVYGEDCSRDCSNLCQRLATRPKNKIKLYIGLMAFLVPNPLFLERMRAITMGGEQHFTTSVSEFCTELRQVENYPMKVPNDAP